MVVLPPLATAGTLAERCAAAHVTYTPGGGYYALCKPENVSEGKDMMMHNLALDTFTIGAAACREALRVVAAGPVRIRPQDVPEGHVLFVQSKSHNRSLPAGSAALMKVPTVQEALRHRRP
jgi:hypothetical protein